MPKRQQNNAKAAADALGRQAARGLLDAALYLQRYYKAKLSNSYPPASLPGEYPRYRTGTGRDAVVVQPPTLAAVVRARQCGVAIQAQGRHLLILELERHRKGLLAAQEECKAEAAKRSGGLTGGAPPS